MDVIFAASTASSRTAILPMKNLAMSPEVLALACDYARHELASIPSDMKMRICFFGGEPLLYTDNINTAMENLLDTDALFNIVTNGSLITQKSDLFQHWKEIVGDRLLVNVSYDYSEQETFRQKGSYETVRNGIRFLMENGIPVRTITVVSADNIEKFPEIFVDYQNLQQEYPSLFGVLNLNYESFASLSWEDELYPKLREIEAISPQIQSSSFRRNDSCGLRGTRFPRQYSWKTPCWCGCKWRYLPRLFILFQQRCSEECLLSWQCV